MKLITRTVVSFCLLLFLLLSLSLLASAQQTEPALQVIINQGKVRFTARQPEWQVHLAVENQLGETLFDSGYNHFGALEWNLTDLEGKALTGGLYRYTLTLQDNTGASLRTHKGSFILEQDAHRLWITAQDETALGADILGGTLTATREAGRTLAGLATTETEQPKRDVSGRDLIDEHGNKLVDTSKAASPNAPKTLLGSVNRLPKFDTNGTSLIDSAVFESGGNVGVGTTSPVAKLTVSANLATPPPQPGILGYFANADESNSFITVDAYGSTGNWHSDFLFRRARGTMAAPQAVQAEDIVGQIQMRGYGATGFSTTSRAGLRMTAAQNWTDTAQGAYLAFMTNPNNSALINVERMRITDAGNVGIGVTAPTARLHVINNIGGGQQHAIFGYATGGYGVFGQATGSGYGVVGTNTDFASGFAGQFNGHVNVSNNLAVGGSLSKSSGSFKIDHPLDPANKYLYHSFVESPDMMNIYNGNVRTDEQGLAVIALPDYFETLNREFRYQLTVIGKFAQAIVSEEINGNQFRIQTSEANTKVSWQVTGVRQDAYAEAHRIPTEELKSETERGSYLHPEVFGQPEEKGIEWVRQPEMMKRLKEQREKAEKEKKSN